MEIEEKIKELFESGKTKPYQIAKELQIDTKDVRKHLREMTKEGKIFTEKEIKTKKEEARIGERRKKVKQLSEKEKTNVRIAQELGVSYTTIRNDIMHIEGIDVEKKRTLSLLERRERIAEMYTNKTQDEIAKELKIGRSTVAYDINILKMAGIIGEKEEQEKERNRQIKNATINREIKKHGIVRENGELESVEELTNRK